LHFILNVSLPENLVKKIPEIQFSFLFLLIVREQLKDLSKEYDKSENDLKALQSVGQVEYGFL